MACVAAVRLVRGDANNTERKYLELANQNWYHVPSILEEYLCSISQFFTDAREEYHTELPSYNVQHWGRVDADTHWMYRNDPHPNVAAQRIVVDVTFTPSAGDHT